MLSLTACAPTKSETRTNGPAPSSQGVAVAMIDGKPITMAELDQTVSRQLYEARSSALEQLIVDRVLDAAARAQHLEIRDYLRREVEKRVKPVTEAEARDFYTQNKDHLPAELASKSFDELKPQLIEAIDGERHKRAAAEIVDELRQRAHVQVLLAAPRVDVAAEGPARGPAGAPITIVEFSDFQCPFCGRAQPVLERVMKEYPREVRLVFRDFPLSFHADAQRAAEAGHCADEQQKFWPLHDWIFQHQGELGAEQLAAAAAQLGLDARRFDACMTTHKYQQVVEDNQAAGERAGVTGTPAFFVNGEPLTGAQPFEKFHEVIERKLKP
jgi:protein-disulfide isomerase